MKRKKRTSRKKIKFLILFASLVLLATALIIGARFAQKGVKNVILGKQTIVSSYVKKVTSQDIKEELDKKNVSYKSFEQYDDETVRIVVSSDTEVFLTKNKDASFQASSLHELLRRLKIDNRVPKRIDMRYDKPVVKF